MKIKNKLVGITKRALNYLKYNYYISYYEKLQLNEKIVLFDSKNGADFASNMFYSLKEFYNEKPDYKYYIVYNNKKTKKKICKLLSNYNITNINYLKIRSLSHYKILATAKYLFSDSTLPRAYIKKKEQIYINTWHGTPLKCMGRDTAGDFDSIGNVQRNLLLSDILVYPSEYMKETMMNAYLINDLYESKIEYCGYPRNSIFFDRNEEKKVRKELNLLDKRVYVYMPTYRGTMKNAKDHINDELQCVLDHLNVLDKKLKENEILYVKLHVFIGDKINFSKYKNIKPFPNNYETYHFLNIADVLITDYSSVFFDFAVSKKKIILFTYDFNDYMKNRGVYIKLDDLPFPKVSTVSELYDELNANKNYDDREFLKKYNTYDCYDAPKKLILDVLHYKKEERKKEKLNILVYCGNLSKNGLTTSFYNLFKNVDKTKFNIYATFSEKLYESNLEEVLKLKEYGIYELPFVKSTTKTLDVLLYLKMYKKYNIYNLKIKEKLDHFFDRQIIKNYGYIHFDAVIQFTGYGHMIVKEFQRMNAFKMIFIHNNIVSELKTKKTRHLITIKSALNGYDKVMLVSDGIYEPTMEIAENDSNFLTMYNICNYEEIIENSKKDIEFSKKTYCNVSKEKLSKILNSSALKIINIGRFSHEKCHKNIIQTFEKYNKENPNSYLIIIGGYGYMFNETLSLVKSSSVSDKIIIIKSINNPMPILKKCDGFVLFSKYEAFPMTLMEADVLSVPIIMSNCKGPYKFWSEHGAKIISLNDEELLEAFRDLGKKKIKPININFKEYNKKWTKYFEDSVIEGIKNRKKML